jgi:transposase InsO family protein
VTCRVLKLARQLYYRWQANPITDAEIVEAYRANALFDAHRDDPEFGYRYLVEEARDAGDNAAMERFFGLLQKNVLDRRRWDTREQLRIAIVTWIERTYHRRRRQAGLGRLTPIEYEAIMSAIARQAA